MVLAGKNEEELKEKRVSSLMIRDQTMHQFKDIVQRKTIQENKIPIKLDRYVPSEMKKTIEDIEREFQRFLNLQDEDLSVKL